MGLFCICVAFGFGSAVAGLRREVKIARVGRDYELLHPKDLDRKNKKSTTCLAAVLCWNASSLYAKLIFDLLKGPICNFYRDLLALNRINIQHTYYQ